MSTAGSHDTARITTVGQVGAAGDDAGPSGDGATGSAAVAAVPSTRRLSADAQPCEPGDPEAAIAAYRAHIDDLDRRILALIGDRVRISGLVQQTRIRAGGRRVQLSREMEVLARYREALGRPGTAVALSVLELCRGRG